MDWESAIARAERLAGERPQAAELLNFARAVVRFQMEIYHRAKATARADARQLDTRMLAGFFPNFVQLVEKYGPRDLAAQALKLEDREDWEGLLKGYWGGAHDRLDPMARAILGPYVQYLAERWRVEVGLTEDGTGSCPFCGRAPLLAILNGHRRLACSLCANEWIFPEKRCPGCAGDRIQFHKHRAFGHVRVEACDGCGHYLKAVDLRREPQAVPVVDEVAAIELDELARKAGFHKFELNLIGQ
ncbi:MAG TPA: formate dehydrogenase accessory protein FdhE [Planctomycetota bacterium]|nr:formate dehydrogenase accessory protein FdhE [Planctomycetota bacterium]